jgi:hypothetical protein
VEWSLYRKSEKGIYPGSEFMRVKRLSKKAIEHLKDSKAWRPLKGWHFESFGHDLLYPIVVNGDLYFVTSEQLEFLLGSDFGEKRYILEVEI